MTILTITLDITDAKLARIKASVRRVRDLPQDPTNAQLEAALTALCRNELRAIVHQAETEAAQEALTPLGI